MSKDEYIERVIKIMQQLDVEMLKKVYTFTKTLNDILHEEG